MRRYITITALIVLAALVALAASDAKVSSDTEVQLGGYSEVAIVADGGEATLYFIASSDSDTVRTHYLLDGIPRQFEWNFVHDEIDSLYIDIVDASQVIYTLN